MSKMYERIDEGDCALGTMILTPGRELAEIAAYSGLDFVCFDMMVTALDWSDAADMVLAAERYGATPWIRLPAFPWGDDEIDPSLPALVLRGLSIGAECVLASVNTAAQVERILLPLANPHRRYYVSRTGPRRTIDQERIDAQLGEQRVVPIIESRSALENLDSILEVKGLTMIYLGMGDLSVALGHARDDRHPVVIDAIADIVARGRRHGIDVCTNVLENPSDDRGMAQATIDRVGLLRDLGIAAVLVPRPSLVLQRFYEEVAVDGARGRATDGED